MQENKVLEGQIKTMGDDFKEFRKETKEERQEFRNQLASIQSMLTSFILRAETSFATNDKIEDKFVLKSNFKVAVSVLAAMATIIWLLAYFMK